MRAYKGLSGGERAFRSLKTVDLKVRPIYHYAASRVRAHVFLCMLAYYVEWHMRQRLKPLLFDDEEPEAAQAARTSAVAPAEVSPSAQDKARSKRTASGESVHSFRTLPDDLATITKNRVVAPLADAEPFDLIARPCNGSSVASRSSQISRGARECDSTKSSTNNSSNPSGRATMRLYRSFAASSGSPSSMRFNVLALANA